jgi:hypothetical protein
LGAGSKNLPPPKRQRAVRFCFERIKIREDVRKIFVSASWPADYPIYWEFAAQNRSSGWNTWLAFSVAPPAEKAPQIVK